VVGGQKTMKDATGTTTFWSLDLSLRDQPSRFKWQVLPSLPGPARILPVAAGQSNGKGDHVYVFSGRSQPTARVSTILGDGYAFDVTGKQWRKLRAAGPGAQGSGLMVMAGSAAPVSREQVLVFSGDRGEIFLELERHDLAVTALRQQIGATSGEAKSKLEAQVTAHLEAKRKIYLNHPGFSRDVIAYDTVRDTWEVIGQSPGPGQVTTIAVPWDDAIVFPNGEIRPATRTPANARLKLLAK